MARLCIDFGGTTVKLGLMDGGDALGFRELTVTGSPDDLRAVESAAGEMLDESGDVTGVGVALPGIVDAGAGTLLAAHGKYEYLGRIDMRRWATDRFHAPAVVENDARAALIGETVFGCAPGARDAVIVTLGTGIGTAAMMDGAVLRGAHGHAAVLGGHVTVDLHAGTCPCGNIGCAEMLASTWMLDGGEASPDGRTGAAGIRQVVDLARAGDPAASATVDRFVRVWGAAVVSLCHAYDPHVVILSGGVMKAADMVLAPLTAYVDDHLWSSSYRPDLLASDAPALSVLRGLSACLSDSAPTKGTQR